MGVLLGKRARKATTFFQFEADSSAQRGARAKPRRPASMAETKAEGGAAQGERERRRAGRGGDQDTNCSRVADSIADFAEQLRRQEDDKAGQAMWDAVKPMVDRMWMGRRG